MMHGNQLSRGIWARYKRTPDEPQYLNLWGGGATDRKEHIASKSGAVRFPKIFKGAFD